MSLPQQTRPRFASIHVRFEHRASPMQKRSHERAVDRFSDLSQSPIEVVGCADPRGDVAASSFTLAQLMTKEADTLPLQVTLAQNLSRVWKGQLRPKRCGANAWYAAAGFSCNELAGRGCLSISCIDVQACSRCWSHSL